MLSSDGLLAADDHLVALLTLSDPDLLDDLAARRLAPLGDLTEGARERLEQTLLAWLDHQGVVKEAADALHVHPQTVRYRVAQLRELFGDELDDPEARYELLLALRSR
jgi:DNA-binding PucR family transcriptional regulator